METPPLVNLTPAEPARSRDGSVGDHEIARIVDSGRIGIASDPPATG